MHTFLLSCKYMKKYKINFYKNILIQISFRNAYKLFPSMHTKLNAFAKFSLFCLPSKAM